MMNLMNSPFYVCSLLFAKGEMHASPETLGLLFGISSVGGVIGFLLGGKIIGKFPFGKVVVFTLALEVIFRTFIPYSPNIFLLLMCLSTIYVATAIMNIASITFQQRTVSDHMQGRVNSVYRTVVFSMQPIGQVLGGICVTQFGPFRTMVISPILYWPVMFIVFKTGLHKVEEGVVRD